MFKTEHFIWCFIYAFMSISIQFYLDGINLTDTSWYCILGSKDPATIR